MTNPSHQPAAAKMLAESNPMNRPGRTEFHYRHAHKSAADAVGRNNAAFQRRADKIGRTYCEMPADEIKRNDSLERQGQKCGSRDSLHAKK